MSYWFPLYRHKFPVCKLKLGRFDERPTKGQQAILMQEKPGWGSREVKESNMITEKQADSGACKT